MKAFATEMVKTGTVNGAPLYLNNTSDGCFARASIVANGLREAGFSKENVVYVFADKLRSSFNYHTAAAVRIDNEVYVVDPLVNKGTTPGLIKYDDWLNLFQPQGERTGVIDEINPETGNVIEPSDMQKLYDYFISESDQKTIPIHEFATDFLRHFSETGNFWYED